TAGGYDLPRSSRARDHGASRMKVLASGVLVAVILLTACGKPNHSQAGGQGILDKQDIVTDLETNPGPSQPSPRVFPGHAIDADRVAHAVGTLLASSDSGGVPSY